MKIAELRALMKSATRDQLAMALAETFKKVPKDKKEELDSILQPTLSGDGSAPKKAAKPEKPEKPKVDIADLTERVYAFTENAWEGNYYYSNRKVPKASRSKWRFLVMGFVKELESVPQDDDDACEKAADLWLELYKVLSRGNIEHLYSGDNPFHSIGIPQEDFVTRMAGANLNADISPEHIREVISAVCRGGMAMDSYSYDVMGALISCFETEEELQVALEQARLLSEELIQKIGKKPKFSTWITVEKIENDNAAENLGVMVLMIASSISQQAYLDNLDFYYEHSYQSNPEVALYVALDIVSRLYKDDEDPTSPGTIAVNRFWVAVCEDGLKRGIEPRNEIQKNYEFLKHHV